MKVNDDIRKAVRALNVGVDVKKNILEQLADDEMIFQKLDSTAEVCTATVELTEPWRDGDHPEILVHISRFTWEFDVATGELMSAG